MSRSPLPPNQGDAELLERHLLARADDGRDTELNQFRDEHPGLIRVAERAVAALRGQLKAESSWVEQGLAKTKAQAGIGPHDRPPEHGLPVFSRTRTNVRHVWQWAWGIAAACIMIAGGLLVRDYAETASSLAHPISDRTYTTTTGQQASITLRDGTRITLAPRTVLRLLDVGSRGRQAVIDGEAYFEVTNATATPFIVRTGVVSTHVLGTAFSVRRYAEETTTRVTVRSGKVSVTTGTQRLTRVVVPAGCTASVTDSSVTIAAPSDMASYTGWLTGRLVFHNAPTAEVLSTLSRWYGYEFRVADPTLVAKNLTAGFSTESAQAALATLKILLDVDLTFDGNTITLIPRRTKSRETSTRSTWRENLTLHQSEVGR